MFFNRITFLCAGTVNEDEVAQDSKDAIVKQEKQALQIKKKPSKKGSTREDKARAVVSAIEEIKREELMLRGVMCGYEFKTLGEMTAPLPLLPHPLQLAGKVECMCTNVKKLMKKSKSICVSIFGFLMPSSDSQNQFSPITPYTILQVSFFYYLHLMPTLS